LEDQAAAGLLMWVPGSLVFLLPLFGIGVQLMAGGKSIRAAHAALNPSLKRKRSQPSLTLQARIELPLVGQTAPASFDALRLTLLGRFLRWRHARLALQLPLLALAGVLIWDGLRGPQVGSMNLAGVLPWIHWRGVLILGLLAAGNVFCMACPFTLPRSLARRWRPQGRPWPGWLRSKWLAVGLICLFLWSYDAVAIWYSTVLA